MLNDLALLAYSGDGQLGARCASNADCLVEGQSCAMSDDPALQQCRVNDGNGCSADADCGPSSTCEATFTETSYAGSVCRASGTGPAPDTLRGRCGSDVATVCDQVVGGGTCIDTGSTSYCAANTGASCDISADCADGEFNVQLSRGKRADAAIHVRIQESAAHPRMGCVSRP